MEDDNSDDTFITSLIAPARAYIEQVGRISFIAGSQVHTFTRWGDYLEVFWRPVTAIAVSYTDASGATTSYASPLVNLNAYPIQIYPAIDDTFPSLPTGGSVTVTVTLGALSATSREYLIGKRATLILIEHWNQFREAAASGIVSQEIAFCISSMLDELRPVSAY